ncbi:MFS transporter [Geodermatophilus sp. DSM 44513]|uniref:MFS transporter n=1 Tax=Geodermatophilus sp. DSM 44513 TaxID=1528104 RepID=UPI00127B16C5|nr:MFS transporter [Geodermatophilus sp. DSM 44513]WNV77625.1 MFS transporter [Geodermatophilus sp. DSM 44513]
MRHYSRLWRVPGAPTLLVGGVVARVGQGVTVIAWLLLIRHVRGNYADAAAVTAAIALLTAVAAPIVGRLADRFAVSRVLPWCAAGYVTTQLALLLTVRADVGLGWLLVLGAASGASFPPMSAALRATWSVLTSPDSGRADLQRTAMAAESALFELAFVVGPLLLSIAALTTGVIVPESRTAGPTAALLVATACTLVGTLWVAWGRGMRSVRPVAGRPPTRGLGPLRAERFGLLLGTAAGVMFAFGVAPVAIAAYAEQAHGHAGSTATGVLIAVWSLGSAVAGIVFGALRLRAGLVRQYIVLLAGLTGGYLVWVLAPGTGALGAALFVTGGVIAPALAVMAGLVAELTDESMRTEAYTWLTTTSMGIAALGSAVAGVVVDGRLGAEGGFLLAAVSTGLALLLAPGLRVRRPATAPVPEVVA